MKKPDNIFLGASLLSLIMGASVSAAVFTDNFSTSSILNPDPNQDENIDIGVSFRQIGNITGNWSRLDAIGGSGGSRETYLANGSSGLDGNALLNRIQYNDTVGSIVAQSAQSANFASEVVGTNYTISCSMLLDDRQGSSGLHDVNLSMDGYTIEFGLTDQNVLENIGVSLQFKTADAVSWTWNLKNDNTVLESGLLTGFGFGDWVEVALNMDETDVQGSASVSFSYNGTTIDSSIHDIALANATVRGVRAFSRYFILSAAEGIDLVLDAQFDNIRVDINPGQQAPLEPIDSYENFIQTFDGQNGFVATNPLHAASDADFDGDNYINLYEYLLGFNPMEGDPSGFAPSFSLNGADAVHTYWQQEDKPTGVSIFSQFGTNLMDLATPYPDDISKYETVTNGMKRVDISYSNVATADQAFWRLKLEPVTPATRTVGLAYTTWHRTGFMAGQYYHTKPSLGTYVSDNPAVIDQHGRWLKEAGVDFVFVDWSNNINYTNGITIGRPDFDMIENSVPILFDVWKDIAGAPKICIMLGAPNPDDVDAYTDGRMEHKVNGVYDKFIADTNRVGQFQFHEGKPLLIIYTGTPPASALRPYPDFDDPRFTIRWITGFVTEQLAMWMGVGSDPLLSTLGYWSWEDRNEQTYTMFNGEPEVCTVSAASRAQDADNPLSPNYVAAVPRKNGETFKERFQRARDLEVKTVLLNAWNEFATGEAPSQELAKELEPTEADGSLYLSLLSRETAAFKGKGLPTFSDRFLSKSGNADNDPDWTTLSFGNGGSDFTFFHDRMKAPPGAAIVQHTAGFAPADTSWVCSTDIGFFGVGEMAAQTLMVQDALNHYRLKIQDLRGTDTGAWVVKFSRMSGGIETDLWTVPALGTGDGDAVFYDGELYRLSTIYNQSIQLFTLRVMDPTNGVMYATNIVDNTFTSGGFGVASESADTVRFDNFEMIITSQ